MAEQPPQANCEHCGRETTASRTAVWVAGRGVVRPEPWERTWRICNRCRRRLEGKLLEAAS